MTKRIPPDQVGMAGFIILDSFWVTTQGHGVIRDGCRFLVVGTYGSGWWLAWRDGIKPLHPRTLGTLLKEEHFQRQEKTNA